MMKITRTLLAAALFTFSLLTAHAQLGGRSAGGPDFTGAIGKLFGDNQAFSATLEIQSTDARSGRPVTLPGKLFFDAGQTRFEVNLGDIKGGSMPPAAAAQLKSMGMDAMVSISIPSTKANYLIYPGAQSYVNMPSPIGADSSSPDDFKIDTTEAGKETVQGHDCIKNNVVITEKNGTKHNLTLWNAVDLNKFPVQMQMNEQGRPMLMVFKDIALKKPDASLFVPPAGFTKYSGMQEMMQAVMTKKMGGALGRPPGQ